MTSSDGDAKVDDEVLSLVGHIWTEAQGNLANLLSVPIDSIAPSKIDEAESVLLSIKELITKRSQGIFELATLSDEFYELIPHKYPEDISSLRMVHRKRDLCQLIRDVVSVSEATNWLKSSNVKAKYKTLGCSMRYVTYDSNEWTKIGGKFLHSQIHDQGIVIHNIFEVTRPTEDEVFPSRDDNKQFLYHSSQPENFVGILSRGLLLPNIIVDDFGGTRTDAGMLGTGIYFASSARYLILFKCRCTVIY